jgi:PTH1 family peptidyl-tRNA hydrolase
MKYLIAGLGNPGQEYTNTRHNIGFKVVDELAQQGAVSFTTNRLADVCQMKYKGRVLLLIKPTTYMNLSGKAVQYWLQAEKIPIENLLVITDDIALPFGTIRLKSKGSDGGHNGLKSIQALLQTVEYPRLRFGIGNDYLKGQQANYVLGAWKPEEDLALNERIKTAADAALAYVSIGIQLASTQYNNK